MADSFMKGNFIFQYINDLHGLKQDLSKEQKGHCIEKL